VLLSQHALRRLRACHAAFIPWPDLDVHVGWNQFLQAADPAELHSARQRSADFNRRYGAAIRKIRKEAGIAQAKVQGITERQLRRIEQGECRATVNALRALAKAHCLDVNAYMEEVAKAMS
jgi:ribosome-binding protein aMBF1 (putative translation factor)